MKKPAVGKTAGPAVLDKGDANHTRRAELPQVPPKAKRPPRCPCRQCIADSLERTIDHLARGNLAFAVRLIQVCIEDLRHPPRLVLDFPHRGER